MVTNALKPVDLIFLFLLIYNLICGNLRNLRIDLSFEFLCGKTRFTLWLLVLTALTGILKMQQTSCKTNLSPAMNRVRRQG